jgi:hypothetical protein
VAKKKKSLGRDPFDDNNNRDKVSRSVEKLIKGKGLAAEAEAREVAVNVLLTPSNLKQLDTLRAKLAEMGKGDYSRNDLIRIAITLLSVEDI